MHYACPLHSTVMGDHLSIMEIIWVMRIKSSPLKFSVIWSVKHLSWCRSYSLGTIGDKPCREHFLLTLSRAVFKQFLRRFCSNDSLKLFSQILLLHFAFSSNNAASCFSNSYPSKTVGHCRPIKQFCAISDKWCWERGQCASAKRKWSEGQSADRLYSQAPSMHYHKHPPQHHHHSHGLNIIS